MPNVSKKKKERKKKKKKTQTATVRRVVFLLYKNFFDKTSGRKWIRKTR
jgi:hypothetical protein